ncbi:MAG: hypothetical protein HOM55_04100 [Proteobacteria bacterium]|nr:hypothetical protein [Pseudomonadota bacterium]
MRKHRIVVLFAALGIFIGLPVAAHHSGVTYFDVEAEIVQHDATVVEYVIVNPHGRLVYTFTDEAGNEQEWSGELASANNLRRRGLGGEVFKPGDKLVTVTGSPSRSGANFMRLTRVDFENGDVAQLTGANAGITRAGE